MQTNRYTYCLKIYLFRHILNFVPIQYNTLALFFSLQYINIEHFIN